MAKAYFYIDDRDPVDNVTDWKNAAGNTFFTCPLVFMTDKMSDIDTVTGRYIFPYDSANPDNYKKRNINGGSYAYRYIHPATIYCFHLRINYRFRKTATAQDVSGSYKCFSLYGLIFIFILCHA